MAFKICFWIVLVCMLEWSQGTFLPHLRAGIPGTCPAKTVKPGFDFSKFEGNWYLLRSELPNEWNINCIQSTYGHNDQTKLVDFSIMAAAKGGGRIPVSLKGKISQDAQLPGKLQLTAEPFSGNSEIMIGELAVTLGSENNIGGEKVDLNILETDYADYAIAYICRDVSPPEGPAQSFEIATVWSRSRNGLSNEGRAKIDNILQNLGIPPSMVPVTHVQTGCEQQASATSTQAPAAQSQTGAGAKTVALGSSVLSLAVLAAPFVF